ncbi:MULTISPECIES: YafY family protein [Variovorax]|uniref:YafY family transcriptional regulator n=1 Tax=Variovorax boronicumulans TaxID=436515 RepID=A0A1E7U4L3_9BURK|nr:MULTISPECIES: YafY family protein [Variovorax]ATA53976.1 YafY family transcriptional regulator [Variovorax boronicumulans]OEZ31038.1 DNA-binding transcriptional regulator [Variovorax boronicumulans]TSD60905.1 YafY family transcriptional regulator [Variovorax sp. KBS0712]GER11856.1 YafY family transcriptional regulator [Variovorax boronicumulans]
MRRADRLFQLVQLIRGRRLTTAAFLAQRLEVSERTVYRDVADLQHQGVPIEGEAGVGYRLGAGFELPPLMFTQDEASALVAAARMTQSWVDPAMARNIETGLGKILSVLPPAARVSAEALALYAPALGLDDALRTRLQTLREAVQAHQKLRLHYRDVSGDASERTVRPLGCFYWGKVWTLSTWCELRNDFRGFRVDRMEAVEVLTTRFQDEPGKTLADLLRQVKAEAQRHKVWEQKPPASTSEPGSDAG